MKADSKIYFKADTRLINYINRAFEGYEYLGVVSTVDKGSGIFVVRATPDTIFEARVVLENLPVTIEFIKHET